MSTDPKEIKWERRKKTGYAPSLRSGCTMTLWGAKEMAILFGGVRDEDANEEVMTSEFFNDLFEIWLPKFPPFTDTLAHQLWVPDLWEWTMDKSSNQEEEEARRREEGKE
jgi:hypothetical protein